MRREAHEGVIKVIATSLCPKISFTGFKTQNKKFVVSNKSFKVRFLKIFYVHQRRKRKLNSERKRGSLKRSVLFQFINVFTKTFTCSSTP